MPRPRTPLYHVGKKPVMATVTVAIRKYYGSEYRGSKALSVVDIPPVVLDNWFQRIYDAVNLAVKNEVGAEDKEVPQK